MNRNLQQDNILQDVRNIVKFGKTGKIQTNLFQKPNTKIQCLFPSLAHRRHGVLGIVKDSHCEMKEFALGLKIGTQKWRN